MAQLGPEIMAHLEWLGFVRPTGLVVSAPALVRAGAILDRRDSDGQRLLQACVAERTFDSAEGSVACLLDFRAFAQSVLGWSFSPGGYAGTGENPIPDVLEVALPDYHETLRPDFAVRELDPKEGTSPWQLLVRVLDTGEEFDRVSVQSGQLEASAHGRMERLLRQTAVPAGLLFNGRALRLLSAPRGESSGWLDFRVADMVQTAGRPISTALRMLLGQPRLLSLPRAQRLTALLEDSRKFQNEVSERLAQQVLHALYELLRGLQAAHDASKGELLREQLAEQPDEVYRALLTFILRLIFLLYAEERDMLPADETFLRYYSLAGLYERLREDAALYPDTMDQRFGAWAQLLVLFRMVHDGAAAGAMWLPKRQGVLFDPDRFKFLEGRPSGGAQQVDERIQPPLVPDGHIYRALEKLLVLDGERISYRALDVEQIGSVYETMIGFRLETATGRSVAVKAQKTHGAPTAVDLETLLGEPAAKREKWLQDRADRKLTDRVKKATAEAATLEDLHAALLPVIDAAATPDLVPQGAMVLQPSEERRRSGSHYTPRALTEPIVRTTLEPILARLRGVDGRPPRPAQILDLKVCDPAMGSGAFLVEACRQLGDALVEAWHAHSEVPAIPPDEDEVIFARRLIAQRCLYGVDRNPVAVDLAKVSLWLVTLAKDHALTFVDHALRHGDSLVGISRKQIEAFHWDTTVTWESPFRTRMRDQLRIVADLRQRIREAGEAVTDWERHGLWDEAQRELGTVRLFGDLVLAAYFEGEKPKDRERKRSEYVRAVVSGEADRYRDWLEEWRHADPPLAPFHWEIEFPEVFERESAGFDAFIGNPPFLGGRLINAALLENYHNFLREFYPGGKGAADLVAYFFRRCFELLSLDGICGLLATHSIAETATRAVGLDVMLRRGGIILNAETGLVWPGDATVTVCRIVFSRSKQPIPLLLNGRPAAVITSSLTGGLAFSKACRLNHGFQYSQGTNLFGASFVLSPAELASARRHNLGIERFLRHFVNGDVLNGTPRAYDGRWVIDFGEFDLEEIVDCEELIRRIQPSILEERKNQTRQIHETRPWLHWDKRTKFFASARTKRRIIACATPSRFLSFLFVDPSKLFTVAVRLFDDDRAALLCVLQSRVHESWAAAVSSNLGSSIRYSTSTSFDTFPFPSTLDVVALEQAGERYSTHRQAYLDARGIGTTECYGLFHNPDERDPEIVKLRELHAVMDRAVLDAYGWADIPTDCKFLLDYEIDEEEWGNKKKPYRYRWPDEVRDEVLARLIELNAERAKEEAAASKTAPVPKPVKKVAVMRSRKKPLTGDMFA